MADLITRYDGDTIKFNISSLNDSNNQHIEDLEYLYATIYDCNDKIIERFSRDPVTGYTTMGKIDADNYFFYTQEESTVNKASGTCYMVVEAGKSNVFLSSGTEKGVGKVQVFILEKAVS